MIRCLENIVKSLKDKLCLFYLKQSLERVPRFPRSCDRGIVTTLCLPRRTQIFKSALGQCTYCLIRLLAIRAATKLLYSYLSLANAVLSGKIGMGRLGIRWVPRLGITGKLIGYKCCFPGKFCWQSLITTVNMTHHLLSSECGGDRTARITAKAGALHKSLVTIDCYNLARVTFF